MTSARPATRRISVADHLRGEIEKAEAEGVSRDDMTLRMTLSDVVELKRDPSLAVADISFAGGVMRFLGVLVVKGGVAASSLSRGDAS